jgi:hypothetical protein
MKVYVISCYYEPDGTSWNIAAFSDKEKAKIMCDRLNIEHEEDGYSYEIQSFMLDEEE